MLPPHDTDDTTLAPTLSDCLLLIASGELLSHYSVKLCIELASAEALTDQSALDLGFIAGSAPNYPRAFNSYDASSAYRLFACFESGYLQGRFERERLPKFIAEKPTGCEGDEGGPSKYARLSDHIGLIFEKLGSAIDRHRDPLATNLQAIIAGSVTACALWFLAMPVTTTAEAYNFAKEASAVHKQAAASYSDDTRRSLQALIQSSLESAEVSPWSCTVSTPCASDDPSAVSGPVEDEGKAKLWNDPVSPLRQMVIEASNSQPTGAQPLISSHQ